MNIFPLHREEAKRKHWVVRWLRYDGYFICIAATIAGMYYAYTYSGFAVSIQNDGMAMVFGLVLLVLGALFGFVVGLSISLPCWAVSMLLDDIHTIRQYMQGYVILDDKHDI